MIKTIYFLAFLIFVSCNLITKDGKTTITSRYETNKSIIIAKNIEGIDNVNFKINKDLLIGRWNESIIWTSNGNLTRTGIRSLGTHHEYVFFPGDKFYYKTLNNDSLQSILKGEFNLSKDKYKIQLAINDKNDSVFKVGDTVMMTEKRIHLLNDSILRIEEHYLVNPKPDIVEYKRIK